MKQRRNLLERVINAAELEAQLQPKLPIVELAGDRRVLIENHLSVIQYGRQEICIKVSYGCVHIRGSGLELARMSKEQLVITGGIMCIELQRKVKA